MKLEKLIGTEDVRGTRPVHGPAINVPVITAAGAGSGDGETLARQNGALRRHHKPGVPPAPTRIRGCAATKFSGRRHYQLWPVGGRRVLATGKTCGSAR